MGLDLGKLIRNVATLGGTYFRDQRRARDREREAQDMIAGNVDLAQELYDRDYGTSALADITADPVMVAAQRSAMERYGDLSRDGWSDLDRRALDQQQMQSRQEEQAQRDAVMAAAARRGDTRGSNTLMAALGAQQGSANRDAARGTDLALEGRERALQALGAYGSMAGQMRSQDFGEQTTRGGAVDQFNQWAAGQRSNDAGMLMNARLGQSQNLTNQAANLRATPNLDAAANAVANYYSMGQAGNVAGPSAPPAVPANPYNAQPSAGHESGHAKMRQPMPAATRAEPGRRAAPTRGMPLRRPGGM